MDLFKPFPKHFVRRNRLKEAKKRFTKAKLISFKIKAPFMNLFKPFAKHFVRRNRLKEAKKRFKKAKLISDQNSDLF